MDKKGFNFELPSKKPKNNREFLFDAAAVIQEKSEYINLWNELLDRKIELENIENGLARYEAKQENNTPDYAYFQNIAEGLKREISGLEEKKKETAKELAKVINDPRWEELKFLYDKSSPSKKDS